MNTLIAGFASAGSSLNHYLNIFIRQQLVWGFVLGFAAAAFLSLLVMTDNPRALPHLLTRSPSVSFSKLTQRDPHGTFQFSYSAFQREYHRVRLAIYGILAVALIALILSLFRY